MQAAASSQRFHPSGQALRSRAAQARAQLREGLVEVTAFAPREAPLEVDARETDVDLYSDLYASSCPKSTRTDSKRVVQYDSAIALLWLLVEDN